MTPLPPPYLDRKKRDVPDLEKIWSFINPMMLYVRHLGFRGNFEKKLAERDPKALELKSQVDAVKNEAKKFMKVKALWQFFEAEAEGNSIHLFETGKTPSQTRVRDSGTWGSRGADPSSGAMEASEMRNEARWEQSLRRYIKSFQFHLGLKGFFIADGLELGQSPMFDHQFSEGEQYNEQLLKWPLRQQGVPPPLPKSPYASS